MSAQLGSLKGRQSAELLQTAIQSASGKLSGTLATLVGIIALILTASGVFTEMQQTLNVMWKAKPRGGTLSILLRSRALSLGLVAALGFLLLVSLVISAILAALSNYINAMMPGGHVVLQGLNFLTSFALITILFGAIYKVLPDRRIEWRDVLVGAIATSLLFTIGKFLIGLYLGSSSAASSYGAAGGLIIVLLWVYYSAQIFLFEGGGESTGSAVAEP
jgi:membrane protein